MMIERKRRFWETTIGRKRKAKKNSKRSRIMPIKKRTSGDSISKKI